ncbi:MarR family transcriptional regulator [Vibrio rotiferianus]|uniref:MarR family winged helix-turn-helix transcriptional regulator n=1 Tax=Vibrio rotiferianus TaxID=190895 RepID=UPI00110FFD5C|nr:MarR family transcriptional regulator [Vibrio rotiferianus]TMX35320.1 MarR family transcriptional regulator [Vibrio rotiferianus]TMX57140.1 MarR family transcriptional regulator [Vibrio rotiferianus]TMX67061.1 MarR family transcriptional regulator [Vibrio rotiferianus]
MSEKNTLDGLFRLVHTLKRNLHEQIEHLDLDITPMHVRVLKIISRKAQCTAIDISNYLDRDKAQVTRLIKVLLEQRLIVKEANPEDKRSQWLRVTDEGNVVMEKIAHVDELILKKMTQDMSSEELEAFRETTSKIVRNLSD